MIYLSQILGKPVIDAAGSQIGTVSDVAIATGEVFPRVTSLAFLGPDKTPFMLSWRKYVERLDDDRIALNCPGKDIRFSYLQPDEVLLHRDLLNKQIVDTQGMKVVRVNDLKLSESRNQLRLLGAEVGVRGILRGIHPALERAAGWIVSLFGVDFGENLIAWNYMDLLDRDLSHVKLSVTHKRLHELHPADVADILEQLSANQRAKVFEHLDDAQAAVTVSLLEDEYQADVIDDLAETRASDLLAEMDPDDAADVIGDLPYEKAERLLRLMGIKESRAIRSLLGYKEKTAGGIMTPEVTTVTEDMTVEQVIAFLRSEAAEHESIYYIFVVEDDRRLTGVVSLRDLIMSSPEAEVRDIVMRDVITADADDDQEDVAETMSKYDLLALPVIDETGKLLGIVTVDDALEVMEEESAEDLALATGSVRKLETGALGWLGHKSSWLVVWLVLGVGASLILSSFSAVLAGFVPVVLFLPLILRMSDDISDHSLSVLIDAGSTGERPPFMRQFAIDIVVGLALGVVSGLIAFAILEILGAGLSAALSVGIATALTIVLMAAVGSVVPYLALKRDGSGWRAPSILVSTGIAALGMTVYLVLATALNSAVSL